MKTNPDAPRRGPSIRLTEGLLKSLGLTCIWLDRITGQDQAIRLALRTIVGRRAVGEKIWFRNPAEAEKVQKAILSRCLQATRNRDGLRIKLPFDQVVGLVHSTAYSLGITPILDDDVATTFDSINRRIEMALGRMKRDGSMKQLNREYAKLRADADGAKSAATSGGTKGTSLPSYSEWLVERLGRELSKCTELAHITRL